MVNATPPAALPQGKRTDAHCIGDSEHTASLDGCGKTLPHKDSISGPFSL
jgi:hypothetical protein